MWRCAAHFISWKDCSFASGFKRLLPCCPTVLHMTWTHAGGKRATTSEAFSLHRPVPRALFGAPHPALKSAPACAVQASNAVSFASYVVLGEGQCCLHDMHVCACSWCLEAQGCMALCETCGCSTRGRAPGSHQWQRDRRPVSARCTPAQCSLTAACLSAAAAAQQDRCAVSLTHPGLVQAVCGYGQDYCHGTQ